MYSVQIAKATIQERPTLFSAETYQEIIDLANTFYVQMKQMIESGHMKRFTSLHILCDGVVVERWGPY